MPLDGYFLKNYCMILLGPGGVWREERQREETLRVEKKEDKKYIFIGRWMMDILRGRTNVGKSLSLFILTIRKASPLN